MREIAHISNETLVELISAVVWCQMSRCDTSWRCNRASARTFLELSYSKTVNCQCKWCAHRLAAHSRHIHSSLTWIASFALSVCPCSACNSIVVLRSVVCVPQTIWPPDSIDAFQSSNDPVVTFGCHSCEGSPIAHSWRKRNFYSVWIDRSGWHKMLRLTLDWLDSFAVYCSSMSQMLGSWSFSWCDCSRKFWRFAWKSKRTTQC